MSVDPIIVRAFASLDGAPLFRIPYTNVSWSEAINEAGSATVTVEMTRDAQRLSLRTTTRPWKVDLAIMRGSRILHAGPVTRRSWDGSAISYTVGGGLTHLSKRLVLNHSLDASWVDGEVLIDDDNPNLQWLLTISGSYPDIARGLVAETLKWGTLPIDLPEISTGLNTRTYETWNNLLVSDKLTDLTELDNGIELQLQPRLVTGHLRYLLRAAAEIRDNVWEWNTQVPGQRVMVTGIDEDGSDMTTQVYGQGGKTDDLVLMARHTDTTLTDAGWPLMQTADTSHQTVSELSTLQSWLKEDTVRGGLQESFSIKAGIEYEVNIGDWADVRITDPYIGSDVYPFKIVGLSASTDEFQTLSARLRED